MAHELNKFQQERRWHIIDGKVTQILKRLDGDGLSRTAHPGYHDQLNLTFCHFLLP